MIVDFKREIIEWNDLEISMRTGGKLQKSNAINNMPISGNDADGADDDLPPSVRRAASKVNSGLITNNYDKHDYVIMINNFSRLSKDEKSACRK